MLSTVFSRSKADIGGLNCAQVVYSAFKEQKGISDETIKAVRKYGSGGAPGGFCGALHSALALTDPIHHDKIRAEFKGKAGEEYCRRIRKLNKISCNECATTAVDIAKKYV